MKPITRADMNGIKKDLNRKGKLLSITDKESCLAVFCFLRDLFYNFTTIIELEENTDPFAIPSEKQLTMIHRLFRAELRKSLIILLRQILISSTGRQWHYQMCFIKSVFIKVCCICL